MSAGPLFIIDSDCRSLLVARPFQTEAWYSDGIRVSVGADCAVTAVCAWCSGAGGSLQAVLEQSLAGSLAGPLHEALRTNFEASLIPAFERATRVSSSFLHYSCSTIGHSDHMSIQSPTRMLRPCLLGEQAAPTVSLWQLVPCHVADMHTEQGFGTCTHHQPEMRGMSC